MPDPIIAFEHPKDFCRCLRLARAIRFLTQREAARRLGVAETTWRNWEVGRTVPTDNLRRLLDDAFGQIMTG